MRMISRSAWLRSLIIGSRSASVSVSMDDVNVSRNLARGFSTGSNSAALQFKLQSNLNMEIKKEKHFTFHRLDHLRFVKFLQFRQSLRALDDDWLRALSWVKSGLIDYIA